MRDKLMIIAIGAGLGAALVFLKSGGTAADTGRALGGAAVDMADGVISGVVVGIGEQVGIPQTDAERGRAELAAGDYWNASFHLPAGEFIAGTWRKIWE